MYKPLKTVLTGLSLILLAAQYSAQARGTSQASSLDRMLAELSTVRAIADVKISPDGQRVAWVAKGQRRAAVNLCRRHPNAAHHRAAQFAATVHAAS